MSFCLDLPSQVRKRQASEDPLNQTQNMGVPALWSASLQHMKNLC